MYENEIKNVLSTLDTLARLEGTMAKFYLACSESWGDSSSLWMNLAVEEERHGKIIEDLTMVVRKFPDQFQVGRRIEISAIESFITWIDEKTGEVLAGKVSLKEALTFARWMEDSILESRFSQLLVSGNRHYLAFMEVLGTELEKHRRNISEEMEKIRK